MIILWTTVLLALVCCAGLKNPCRIRDSLDTALSASTASGARHQRQLSRSDERRSQYSPFKRQLRRPGVNSSLHAEAKQDIYLSLSLARAGRPDEALALFLTLVAQDSRVIRPKECNLLIKELGDRGCLDHCANVLQIMKSGGIIPTLVTYSTLISRSGNLLKTQLAQQYFEEMLGEGIAPDLSCYNSLINSYAKVGNTHRALELFADMALGDIAPDVITFNTIIDAYARAGRPALILDMMREMRSRNLSANERTYCSLVQAYCQSDQVEVALNLTARMERDRIRISEVTYSTLLHALGRAGDLARAFELLRSMRDRGIQTNVVSMTSLVDACARHGKLELAFKLYEEMRRSSSPEDRPNSVTFSSLVDACLKRGEVERAFQVLRDMRESGAALTEVTYTSLISELSRLNMLDRIEEAVPPKVEVIEATQFKL